MLKISDKPDATSAIKKRTFIDRATHTCAKLSRSKQYVWIFVAIAAVFLLCQVSFILRTPLVPDELQNAVTAVYKLFSQIPYRDYHPYKTVVGYYIQAIPLLFIKSIWWRFMSIEIEMAIISAIMFFIIGLTLKKMFGFIPAALALLLLAVMPNFFEHSSDLRVDMLTSWAALISLLFLLNGRYIFAGLFCGLSAVISQKAGVHGIGCAAYFACGLLILRDKRFIKYIIKFTLATAVIIVVYIAVFGVLSSNPDRVIRHMFASHSLVKFATTKSAVGSLHFTWYPLIYYALAFWILTFAALIILPIHWFKYKDNPNYLLLPVYIAGIIAVLLCIPRPYSYDYVLIIPQISIMLAMLFSQEISRWRTWPNKYKTLAVWLFVVAGLIAPIGYNFLKIATSESSYQQRNTLEIAAKILQPGDTYFASRRIFFNNKPAVPSFSFFDPDHRAYYSKHGITNKRAKQIISQMKTNRMKLYIMGDMYFGIPKQIKTFFLKTYKLWKYHVYLYCPTISPKQSTINLLFSGTYKIKLTSFRLGNLAADAKHTIILDGKIYHVYGKVHLTAGKHNIKTKKTIRLQFIP